MATSAPKFHFIVVVWGAAYVDVFTGIVLPSHLSAGNLGSVPAETTLYKIYTTAPDAKVIRESGAFKALSARFSTQFIPIDEIIAKTDWARSTDDDDNYYAPMIAIHRMAIASAIADPAVSLIVAPPDSLISDGTFRFAVDAARYGKRAALVLSLRGNLLEIRESAMQQMPAPSLGGPGIAPRQIVDWLLRYPHPTTAQLTWAGSIRQIIPTHWLFPVANSGFVARGMHFHPLMVRPSGAKYLPAGFIDEDYVDRLRLRPRDVAVATDSDVAIACELSRPDQHQLFLAQGTVWTPRRLGYFFANVANRFHQLCFQYAVYVHSQDPDPAWPGVDAEASRVARTIRKWMLVYWLFPFPGSYRFWLALKIPMQRRWGKAWWYLQLKRVKIMLARWLVGAP